MNGRQEIWGNFISFYRRLISFYRRFIQGLSKSAKPLSSMLKTTPTRSAKNSPSDMAEDAEVGSGTSSTTRSAENLSASVDMAEDAKVGKGDDGDDETVERASSKKPNVSMGYLTSLRSGKRWVSLDIFGYGWDFQLEALPKWLQAKFVDTTNWTFTKFAGSRSFLDTILHRLSINDLWASVLLWVAFSLWAWLFDKVLLCKTHAFSQLRQCLNPYQIKVSTMPKDV